MSDSDDNSDETGASSTGRVINLNEWREGRQAEAEAASPSSAPTSRSTVSEGETIARLEHVSYIEAGRRVLDHVDLAIRTGGATVLLGPYAVGSSAVLRLFAGLSSPLTGRVSAPDPGKKGLIFVASRPVMMRRTLRGNLLLALRLAGAPRNERANVVEAMLAAGGLTAVADHPARSLSRGEQQRAALLRALVFRPRLLLLQDPCCCLDLDSAKAVETLIVGATEAGVKVVCATNDLGQARRLASEIVVLHNGRVAEQTAAERFFESPTSAAGLAYLDGRLQV